MKLFSKKTTTKKVARRRLSQDVSQHGQATPNSEYYTYRRNRTLTGSLSSNVSSATERSAELRSPRLQSHDLRRHRRKLGGLLLASIAVAGALLGLVYQSIATVEFEVTSPTLSTVDTSTYQKITDEYFAGHPLERFRFSLDEVKLARHMQENGAPEIESVGQNTKFAGFGKSNIPLSFRRPVVSWSNGSTSLYVDKAGAAFERNYFEDPGVKVVDQSGISTKDNQVVASSRFLAFMGKIIGRMADQGLVVSAISLPVGTTRQVDVTLEGRGYPIKFSTDRATGVQSEDAARALQYLDGQGITPEYVDVRVSGRAYYK